MTFDFDTTPDRRNTASLKWEKYAGQDIIPKCLDEDGNELGADDFIIGYSTTNYR